jgi:hypothetical protein
VGRVILTCLLLSALLACDERSQPLTEPALAHSSDCAAGLPYCYQTPVHLNPLVNTPGFEGGPALSADGLETINCPTCFGGLLTIRGNGEELCWMGDRGDSYGDKDVYCAHPR